MGCNDRTEGLSCNDRKVEEASVPRGMRARCNRQQRAAGTTGTATASEAVAKQIPPPGFICFSGWAWEP